jgi:hypothetical protein
VIIIAGISIFAVSTCDEIKLEVGLMILITLIMFAVGCVVQLAQDS